MEQLKKGHAEIRFSAVQVIDQVFMRSHAFRCCFANDMHQFFRFAVETDPMHLPLPPPKAAAKELKLLALLCLYKWREKYGRHYKKFEGGYQYLINVKKVKFDDVKKDA